MAKRTITVDVDGVGKTVKAIGLFDTDFRNDLIDTVKQTAVTIQKSAKRLAPVAKTPVSRGKKGDLKRSIRPRYFDGGLSATVVPRKPKGSHRHLVEYGTTTRQTSKGANRGKMPSIPFMGPAETSAEGEYNRILRSMINRDKDI